MRNRTRNRKQLEKEADRNVAFYAEGGPFDAIFEMEGEAGDHGLLGGHHPFCDVFDRPPEGIVKQCNCGPKTAPKPLCYQEPCNDPACRLDHADREAK